MKKAKLVQAFFTQEEIAAINTKNIKLEEENKELKEKYDGLWKIYTSEANELKEENNKLKSDIKRYEKEEDRLREENKNLKEENEKLRANYYNLSKIVEASGGYKSSYVNELRDKIAKLEFDIEAWKKLKAVREEKERILNEKIGKLVMDGK